MHGEIRVSQVLPETLAGACVLESYFSHYLLLPFNLKRKLSTSFQFLIEGSGS